MTESRWEWRLPAGENVAAVVDSVAGTESVFVGPRLTSQSARGAKPDGHLIAVGGSSASSVTVTFDPHVLVCILRIDGDEIAPTRWPVRTRTKPAARKSFAWPLSLLVVLAMIAGVALVARERSVAGSEFEMSGAHRSENGLFVAHYPKEFSARTAPLPPTMSGVLLADPKANDAVAIVALSLDEATHDPWVVNKRLYDEAMAVLPRSGGMYEETSRHDGVCLGQHGAIVTARAKDTRGAPADVVSCALAKGNAGYLLMTSSPASDAAEEKRVQQIVNATELTELGQLVAPAR